jgi:hypothetical protein
VTPQSFRGAPESVRPKRRSNSAGSTVDELARRFPPDALIVVVDPTRYPLQGTTTPDYRGIVTRVRRGYSR